MQLVCGCRQNTRGAAAAVADAAAAAATCNLQLATPASSTQLLTNHTKYCTNFKRFGILRTLETVTSEKLRIFGTLRTL